MVDLWILLVGLFLIASALAILVSLFLFLRSRNSSYAQPSRQRKAKRPARRQPLNLSSSTSRVKALQADLTRRLQGDRAAAQRLYQYAQRGCPGKSEVWYWEKAIAQYERDRH